VDINWLVFSPPLVLLLAASVGVILGVGLKSTKPVAWLSLGAVLLALVLNASLFGRAEPLSAFGLRYLADTGALAFNTLILMGTALALLLSVDRVERDLGGYEYYPLMLLSAMGGMIMASAGDFITLLLGLEILSLAVYVLSAWRTGGRHSEEAGMKYFLLGAFASAFLIYGIALLYGATGQFTYVGIVQTLLDPAYAQRGLATLGGAFILGGLAFKAAFVPFHQWAPDVYTGAPTPVTAFMSVVVKAAAFAALVRVFGLIYPDLNGFLTQALVVLVALTLVIANFAALVQKGLKRLLAYSAVAHAGYLGLAVLGANTGGIQAAIWYLTAYTFMTLGAFAVLAELTGDDEQNDDLERLEGLGRTRPRLALALSIFLMSLAGLPPLAGFVGKIMVFRAALESGYMTLAVIAILTSILAVYYYLRLVAKMYFGDAPATTPTQTAVAAEPSRLTGIAIGVAAVLTVVLGILPGWWFGILQAGQYLARQPGM
jgi:NADH-quinone oxidoreductase subunit N